MFYEAQLAFNEGGNDGFWRFQLRDKFGRWIKMGGAAMFEFRKPNDKNVYKAKGTFQGNIRRGASIIRVGEGEQLPPGDYEIDSRYIESIKAIINTTSAKPEIVDAPKSVNPDVEKQATEREMVSATVKDLEAGDIVQQSTEEALYGQINSVEHGDAESKINVTWSDGSNYDMTLPGDQKIRVWGAEPEAETVDAGDIKEPSHDRLNVPDGQETSSDVLKYSQSREVADFISSHFDYSETPEHVSAVNIYVGDDASTLERNKNLREGLDASEMQELDAWTNGGTVSNPVRVYRGIIASDEVADSYVVGSVVSDKSFVSAAVNKQQALVYQIAREQDGAKGRRITFMIDLDEGVHAGVAHMGEVVLPRGTDFEVVSSKVLKSGNRAITLRVKAKPETVDAGNVEEAAPEVPERTKVIASEREASTFYQEFRKKFGLSSAPGTAAMEHKRNAAKLVLDEMIESGITPDQLAAASRSGSGISIVKYGSGESDVLDYVTVANKIPEIDAGSKSRRVSSTDMLNMPYDDNTVVEASAPELNVMKFHEDGRLQIFTIPNIEGQVEVVGKTLKEIETAVNEEPSLSGYYGKLSVVGTSESKRMLAEHWTSNMIHIWANTSNDADPTSLAMQETAKTMFGLDDVAPWDMGDVLKGDVQRNLDQHGAVYEAFLKAQYDVTQEFFAEQGIKEFELYRGFTSKEKVETGYVDTVLRPLSSFSTSKTVAEEFALPGSFEYAYVVDMTVPAKDILSMPGLGFGCLEEEEFVVLGGKKSAFIEML
jgi:hypothetical protein